MPTLREVDPVQLVYEYRPENIFKHWVIMAPGTYNNDFYGDVFRTRKWASERLQWLEANVGRGSQLSAGQYVDQKWFVYEWGKVYAPRKPYVPSITSNNEPPRELLDPGGAAVCFMDETSAILFKMRWG